MRDYSDEELINAIDRWIIGKNAERNRIILKLRHVHGYTYEQISEYLYNNEELPPRYKLGVKQIGRIINDETLRLRRHL